jgi:hypothetical protein
MSRVSTLRRSISTANADLVFLGMLSPAHAAYQRDGVSVFPDLPISTTAARDEGKSANLAVARSPSIVLTSHLPWHAPVGHRQPPRADVPEDEAVSAWERQQQLDQELDRKLIICRGC